MKKISILLLMLTILVAGVALAQEAQPPVQTSVSPPKVDTGDTSWILISSALVMLMTPGLALFYGGMVRSKNVLGTIMQSFIALAVITLQWVLYGYSLAFGPDIGHVIGGLDWIGLKGVGLDPFPDYSATIPHQAFMIFQMMFAVITPALITGAFAERFKFKTYLVFLILWATFVYDPIAHWVWGVGGWIRNLGALDFAGGLVVHVSSGIAALAAALLVGKRRGYGEEPMPPHNLTMTLLGAALLWFGWFGFNGGSAVASGSLATSAFVVTHIATAAAALSWMIAEWAYRGNPTVLGAASGAVAGLVAITPASGFVVHGVGGTWGALATGLFASKAVNAAGNNGLFFGNPSLIGIQAISVVSAWIYSFVVTLIILKALDWTMGLRISEEHEIGGLDLSQHGEAGYSF